MAKEIDSSHSAQLRFALGIHWPLKVSNDNLYQQSAIPRCHQTIRHRRLRLYSHIMRHWNEIPAGLILHTEPTEKFRVGGHRRITYEKAIKGDLNLLQATVQDTSDRPKWKEVCESAFVLFNFILLSLYSHIQTHTHTHTHMFTFSHTYTFLFTRSTVHTTITAFSAMSLCLSVSVLSRLNPVMGTVFSINV